MLVEDVPEEAVSIGEALGAGTLPHAHHSVLLRVQHPTLQQQIKPRVGTAAAIGQHLPLPAEGMDPAALTCLPMGSGLVTVVLKKPSHSRRP